MNPVTPQAADAALRQLRGVVAHCLHEADHLPEGALLSHRWSIDAFDALRLFEALDDLITHHGQLPTDWAPIAARAPVTEPDRLSASAPASPVHPPAEGSTQ